MIRCLVLLLLTTLAVGQDQSLAERVRTARARVFPTLVHIVNVEEGLIGAQRRKSVSSGSGFFIDESGHVVTNYHVAGQAQRLFVTLASGRKVRATLVAGDPYTDLAVIRVDPKQAFAGGQPVAARFGDSGLLREGDFVMAMGSPLSLARSASFGIISCRNRTLSTMSLAGHETGKYNTWLQTDAAINPGNSGGPLVNLRGEVIGVNTRANLGANNIGFAIPSNVVREIVASLIKRGRVPRSFLGLTLQPREALADTALTARSGVLVAAVASGSPAARSGLRPGDFILELNGQAFSAGFVEELPGLYDRIAKLALDKDSALKVRRAAETRMLRVRPEALGRQLGRETVVARWGVSVRGITERMMRENGLADTAGVVVTGVRPGGAAVGRLERGDIIRYVQGEPVTGLGGFLGLTATSVRGKDPLVRLVLRRGGVTDVTTLRPKYDPGK